MFCELIQVDGVPGEKCSVVVDVCGSVSGEKCSVVANVC